VPLLAAIIAAWLVPACIRGGPVYTDTMLWKQNLGRAVGESWSHARPFWYYVPYLLFLFPWVLFLPWAAPWAWRRRGFPRAMLLWAAVGFVFFSAISGKRDRYLTPLYPPIAIVLGAWLDGATDALSQRWIRVAARIATGFFMVAAYAFGAAGLALISLALNLYPKTYDIEWTFVTVPMIVGAFAFGAILFAVARRGIRARREGNLPHVAGFVVLGMVVFMLAYDFLLVPQLDQVKSPRPVAEAMNAWPGEVAAYPAHFSGAYNLYSGRLKIPVLETTEEVLAHLGAEGERLVLTSRESYERPQEGEARSLKEVLAGRYHATPIGQVGHRDMLFLTNYEPPR